MAKRQQPFPCEHTGQTVYCHRGQQEASIQPATPTRRERQHPQQEPLQLYTTDPIDLRHLPQPRLVEQARAILIAISNGVHYHKFNGKRMHYNKRIISIPLNYSYRLIFRKTKDGFIPLSCDSHETYNKRRYV